MTNRRVHQIPRPLSLIAVLGLILSACSPTPHPIHYGEDTCAYCVMTISDERYGAELVSRTGKVYKFDSVECMAAYEMEEREGTDRIHSRWVTDYAAPGELIELKEAFILHSDNLRSPMGMNLTAFGPRMTPRAAVDSFAGQIVDWNEVREIVGRGWDVRMRPAHDEAR